MKHFAIYNPETLEFAGLETAFLDPLETAAAGQDVYLTPPNSTDVLPPEIPAGHVARWNGTAWDVLIDQRGTPYWLPGDKWNSEPKVQAGLGPLPVGAVLTRPEKTPAEKSAEAYQTKYIEINDKCQTALEGLTKTYPDRELLTFERQEREARALLAGDSADVGHITAIAQGRGLPVDALARKIVEKADAFALASGALIGQRQKYEDELEALGKEAPVEQIESISVVYTIPADLM